MRSLLLCAVLCTALVSAKETKKTRTRVSSAGHLLAPLGARTTKLLDAFSADISPPPPTIRPDLRLGYSAHPQLRLTKRFQRIGKLHGVSFGCAFKGFLDMSHPLDVNVDAW